MSDILRRLNRIQKLNEISSDMDTSFRFPREESRRLGGGNASLNQNFPSHSEINDVFEKARKDVVLECEKLGMVLNDAEQAFQEISLRNVDAENNEGFGSDRL
ncbi:hypothetical protein RN001_001665 [Aquatica leii]|uniref:Uncharacterized protein n=1 Tax=Aquatica leii TaxID=1421715 RepID=A0AAN7Q4E7_9COLE|nr:hypothetical protein RN001_001665 [Aquatica leii]